jgi:hypothetical protein
VTEGFVAPGAFMMGDTSIRMLMFWHDQREGAARVERLVEHNA